VRIEIFTPGEIATVQTQVIFHLAIRAAFFRQSFGVPALYGLPVTKIHTGDLIDRFELHSVDEAFAKIHFGLLGILIVLPIIV
jgi:hypothetical protein